MSSKTDHTMSELECTIQDIRSLIEAQNEKRAKDEQAQLQSMLDYIDSLAEETEETEEAKEEMAVVDVANTYIDKPTTKKLRILAPYKYQQISTEYTNENQEKELWFFETEKNQNSFLIDSKKILFMEHFNVSETKNVKEGMTKRDLFEVWGPLLFFVVFAYVLNIYWAIPALIAGGLAIHWVSNKEVKKTIETRMIKLCFKTDSTFDTITIPASQVEVVE